MNRSCRLEPVQFYTTVISHNVVELLGASKRNACNIFKGYIGRLVVSTPIDLLVGVLCSEI